MYLDTAILVKLVVPEPDSAFYGRLVDGATEVWSSEVSSTEGFAALLRKEREGSLATPGRIAAWRQWEAQVAAGSLRLVPMTRALLRRANRLLEACHPAVPLRSLDAIHLASVEESGTTPLVTNDRVLRAAAAKLGFALAPGPTPRSRA